MRRPPSLQARLAVSLGVALTLLWVAAASVTAVILRREINEVFDAALQETAQRLLPLAVVDIVGREDEGVTQRLGQVRAHGEYFTYVVRDAEGRILLQSHAADPRDFPPYDGAGFRQTATHRIYNDEALKGSVRISVAEPIAHRASVSRETELALGLPLLVVIPIALIAILLGVRASLAPVKRFRARLQARSARDLSPVPGDELPAEFSPVAVALNDVLARLKAAFEAERSFAANAAHELRTPLAGAMAQAQRLRSETADPAAAVTPAPAAAARAADIEATLKRLTRLAERLMQLARAEGGRLRTDAPSDLRIIARLMVEDAARAPNSGRIALSLPERPVLSDLDPDAFGIVCRNLIDNALRHGAAGGVVEVSLTQDGVLTVANDSAPVPPETLARLTARFERGMTGSDGSGLGLAIVAAIAERLGSELRLRSPRAGQEQGFEAAIHLPVEARAA